MCKSLYVVNSGFNQPSFFFFGAITRDVLPVNLDWEHVKTTSCGFFWTYNESIKVGPHKSCWKNISNSRMFQKMVITCDYTPLFSYIFICVLTPSQLLWWSTKSTTKHQIQVHRPPQKVGVRFSGENRPVDELLMKRNLPKFRYTPEN